MKRFAALPIAVGLLASLVATAPAGVAAPSPAKPKTDWLIPLSDVEQMTVESLAGDGVNVRTGGPKAETRVTASEAPSGYSRYEGASAAVEVRRRVAGENLAYKRKVTYGFARLDSAGPDAAKAWCAGENHKETYPYGDDGCWSLGTATPEKTVSVVEPLDEHYLVWAQTAIGDYEIGFARNSPPPWPELSDAGLVAFTSTVLDQQKAALARALHPPVKEPKPSEPTPIRDLTVSNFDVKNGLTTFDVRFAGTPGASYLVGLTDEEGNEITRFQTVKLDTCRQIPSTKKYIGGCDIANATVTFPNDEPAAVLNVSNKPTNKERAYNMSTRQVWDPYSFALIGDIFPLMGAQLTKCDLGLGWQSWQALPGDREDIKAVYDATDRNAAFFAGIAATYAAQTSYLDVQRAGLVADKWAAKAINEIRRQVTRELRRDLTGVGGSRHALLPDPQSLRAAASAFAERGAINSETARICARHTAG